MRRRASRTKRIGPKKVNVPNLAGLTRAQAQAALLSAGLTYSESTTDTSDISLTSKIQSQGYSSNSTVLVGTNVSFVYYNYVDPVTYGPCEAYGSGVSIGSGSQCSGSFYQTYTDYRYNTRKKIYVGGVWDGSSYSTEGCGTTDSRSITGSSQIDGLCGYSAPITVTYGACEAYGGAIANVGSGSYCDGNYTVTYTDYRYNARRAIYYNGSWDGSSYTTSGCSTVDSRTINSYSQVNGSCGYTPPAPVITYGACTTYTESNLTIYECSGTFSRPVYANIKEKRRAEFSNGSPTGNFDYNCAADITTTYGSYSQVDGQCGYSTPPPACVCNYSDYGSYHYSPQCCPGGSQRTGSLGGTTVNSCCPNVSKTLYAYQCKAYDVNDRASTNYYDCYSVGACSAPRNPDGSRTGCYS